MQKVYRITQDGYGATQLITGYRVRLLNDRMFVVGEWKGIALRAESHWIELADKNAWFDSIEDAEADRLKKELSTYEAKVDRIKKAIEEHAAKNQ